MWKVKTVLVTPSSFDIHADQICSVSAIADEALELYSLKLKLFQLSNDETFSTPNVTVAINFCPLQEVAGSEASHLTVLI